MSNAWTINKVTYSFNFLFLHFGKHEQTIGQADLIDHKNKGGFCSPDQIDPNMLSQTVGTNQPAIVGFNKSGSAWGSWDAFTGSPALEQLKKGDRIDVVDPTGRHTGESIQYVQKP